MTKDEFPHNYSVFSTTWSSEIIIIFWFDAQETFLLLLMLKTAVLLHIFVEIINISPNGISCCLIALNLIRTQNDGSYQKSVSAWLTKPKLNLANTHLLKPFVPIPEKNETQPDTKPACEWLLFLLFLNQFRCHMTDCYSTDTPSAPEIVSPA